MDRSGLKFRLICVKLLSVITGLMDWTVSEMVCYDMGCQSQVLCVLTKGGHSNNNFLRAVGVVWVWLTILFQMLQTLCSHSSFCHGHRVTEHGHMVTGSLVVVTAVSTIHTVITLGHL